MKRVTNSPIHTHGGKRWWINAGDGFSLRTDILKCLLGQLDVMLQHHRKVFVYRFDLHVSEYTNNNKLVTNFNRRLFKRIERHYETNHIADCWVREQEKAKQQHYHYVLILDGGKVQNPYELNKWITGLWEPHGSVHFVRYHNISRDDEESIQAASYHISYLAKPRGKGYRPIQTKDFGASRLKQPSSPL